MSTANTQLSTVINSGLRDRFGRTHNYLRVSLTEKCNLRCTYCMPAVGIPLRPNDLFMQREEIFEICKVFCELGITKIRLTGGEPLVRKDAKEIIQDLSKLDVELAISTNGILVDQYIKTFKEAGLRKVNVSLDTLNEAKQAYITRRNYFQKIMSNLDLLYNNNFELKINAVLLQGLCAGEICDMVEMGRDKNISIRFIEFMPFNGNEWDLSKCISKSHILQVVANKFGLKNIHRLDGDANDTAKIFKIGDFNGNFGIISTVTDPFCSSCNRIRLTADGKIKNCLFSKAEIDLLTAYRNNQPLQPLIQNSIMAKEKQRGGMDRIEDFSNPKLNELNRSMIAIGG